MKDLYAAIEVLLISICRTQIMALIKK